jgi:hypothetical protein
MQLVLYSKGSVCESLGLQAFGITFSFRNTKGANIGYLSGQGLIE